MSLKTTLLSTAVALAFNMSMSKAASEHTVMVLLEAKPGQEQELKEALVEIVEPSRSEDHSVDYRLHQSKSNKAQFMLYENWSSAEQHQTQFEKPYIKAFSQKVEGMLAKPYQVFVGYELVD